MENCPNCQRPTPPDRRYSGSSWCHDCVTATLADQAREDTAPVRPEVIQT